MRRREFLLGGAAFTLMAGSPKSAAANAPFAPRPDAWRKFEVTTRVEVLKRQGKAQVWVPLPAVDEPDWTRPLGNEWTGNAKSARLVADPIYRAQMLHAEWPDGEPAPVVDIVSRVATRDRAVDLSRAG